VTNFQRWSSTEGLSIRGNDLSAVCFTFGKPSKEFRERSLTAVTFLVGSLFCTKDGDAEPQLFLSAPPKGTWVLVG
jgi:hypothetical protein